MVLTNVEFMVLLLVRIIGDQRLLHDLNNGS